MVLRSPQRGQSWETPVRASRNAAGVTHVPWSWDPSVEGSSPTCSEAARLLMPEKQVGEKKAVKPPDFLLAPRSVWVGEELPAHPPGTPKPPSPHSPPPKRQDHHGIHTDTGTVARHCRGFYLPVCFLWGLCVPLSCGGHTQRCSGLLLLVLREPSGVVLGT